MPKKNDAPLLSPKFSLALQFANEIHRMQVRKGAGAPYISHLMSVCALALESCRSCPGDCGACAPVCGDLVCGAGEVCPADCVP